MPTTTTNTDSYASDTPLVKLFGPKPRVKILAVLLAQGRDINASTIAELAGVSRSSVYDHLDPLITLGLVNKTREINGSPLYEINKDSPSAKKLAQLEMELVYELSREEREQTATPSE